MASYPLQHVLTRGEGLTTRRCKLWEDDEARFSSCALPIVALVPMITILIIAVVQLIPRKWWPKWTNPFVPDEDGDGNRNRNYVGTIILLVLGFSAAILQIVNLSQPSDLKFHDIYVGTSWFLLVMVVALSRPRHSPTWLFPFYFLAVVADLSSIRSWTSNSNHGLVLHICSSLCGLTSIFTILCMPYRSASVSSGPISNVWTQPSSLERSPEDGMSMWQFLTGTWVWPLMILGKERQLQKTDVWGIRYEVQAEQLAIAFRKLHGSTIFRRLLRANATDLTLQWLLAAAHNIFEFASPLLLHQFLYVLENPSHGKRPAAFYGLLLFARGVLWSQVSMLLLWYGRRSYEQTRGVLTMAVFEKTLSRKLILDGDDLKVKRVVATQGSEENGKPAHFITTGKRQVEASQDSTELNGNAIVNGPKPQQSGKPKTDDRSTRLALFKDLFWGTEDLTVKSTGAASTGQVLHIVKSDIDDAAKRFQESYRILRAPMGIVIAVWLIWRLLGPSCFLGILVLVISQLINAAIARLRIRYQKYAKRAKDNRIQSSSQFIGDIRHLRWFGWQNIWLQKVFAIRQHELNVRFVGSCLSLLTYTTTVVAGSLFPVVAFIAYTAIAKQKLRIDLIFPALQLFSSLDARLRGLPDLVTSLLNAYVAMERIEDFIQEPDLKRNKGPDGAFGISTTQVPVLEHCDFAWPGKTSPVLRNVNMTLPPGLTLVYGEIGSGKTALLLSLMAEMDLLDGRFDMQDRPIAYCAQNPWLQSASIRENILYSTPYEEERYQATLNACELLPDMLNFPNGDLSLLGENGIGLSGGQCARVALARALYSRAGILILDDPLAALDHGTAEGIVEKCFSRQSQLLGKRTVVLATHRVSVVQHVAVQCVQISNGKAVVSSTDSLDQHPSLQELEAQSSQSRRIDRTKTGQDVAPQQFMEDEKRQDGGIKAKVFWIFFRAGRFWWAFLLLMLILLRVFGIAEQWFFKSWGESYGERTSTEDAEFHGQAKTIRTSGDINQQLSLYTKFDLPNPNEHLATWIGVLLFVSLGRSLSSGLYVLSQVTAVRETTRNMFIQVMDRVSGATFRYYDVTPMGRIMNRITSDIDMLNTALDSFGNTISAASFFAFSMLAIAAVSPMFFCFAIICMIVFAMIFTQYLPASRSLKRMEASSLSPLYGIFGELLSDHGAGLLTLRAFHAQGAFRSRAVAILDEYQAYGHFSSSLQIWLTYRYDMISAFSTLFLIGTALATDLSPGLTAFLLLNTTNFINSTHMLCSRFGGLQAQFVSVERVVELLDIEEEPVGAVHPPAAWPQIGSTIIVDNVTIRYAANLDPSLHNVSLTIPGGRTTAIIGRTGSGKSTLASAILNIVRPEPGGEITIDNISLTDINVQDLRRRVTFIPQNPILFPGTMRENLDPIEEFSDEQCSAVLARVCASLSTPQTWTLDTHVESGGRNFSQGQRQVIGVARAILRRSPIVILDEAMASIDSATAIQLQNLLREELAGATLVVIAHRLEEEAVKQADYEIVLDNGKVVRQGLVDESRFADGTA